MEGRIKDAAYVAQDILDLHQIQCPRTSTISTESSSLDEEHAMKLMKSQDLKTDLKEIDSIKQELDVLNKEESVVVDLLHQPDHDHIQARPFNSLRARFSSDCKNLMVGMDDLSMQIKDHLAGESSALQVITLVGMGGAGKTTLAINTYNDPYLVNHFDIRAWVTVSQSYSTRNILSNLLDSMKQLTREMSQESDDESLACHLYKCLKEKRYLIIIDDIWDTDAWDAIRRVFPNDDNGSRIMLTTRVTDVAAYAGSTSSDRFLYQMPLLSDDSSWKLICEKVFGSESCPTADWEEIGKHIAQKCQGLPLSIIVIAGLLSKVDKTYQTWKAIAENKTWLASIEGDLSSQILKMSFNFLPQHLKACFLYMGSVFPEDHEIDVYTLAQLWVAEGFLDSIHNETREDIATSYLQELIDRSLVLISKKKLNGTIKTCRVHDLVHELCVREAEWEKILHVTKSYTGLFLKVPKGHRRLSFHSISSCRNASFRWIGSRSSSSIRSLVCIGEHIFLPSSVFKRFKLLRVLDVASVVFNPFPYEVLGLGHLRYLAFTYRGDIPSSLSNMHDLQTLMINSPSINIHTLFDGAYILPSAIWKMKQLRHILLREEFYLEDSIPSDGDDDLEPLIELQTVSGIRNMRFTEKLIRRIPNIRKLSVVYSYNRLDSGRSCGFENLAKLHQLRELKINLSDFKFRGLNKFDFPKSLQTLSLRACRVPWKDLSPLVGSLPHLQVLKLQFQSCVGEAWDPQEGEFCELRVLVLFEVDLIEWNAEPHHFPRLERLVVRSCLNLKEIPISFGESSTLNTIELQGRIRSCITDSAKKIKSIQSDLGNEDFQIIRSKVALLNDWKHRLHLFENL